MNSYPFITTRYTYPILSLEQGRKWLRMDINGYEGEDTVINDEIKAAVSSIEKECNISLGVSDYLWNTSCLPCNFKDAVNVKSITKIEYHDGTQYQEIDSTNYELLATSETKSEIIWKTGFSVDSNRIRVTFKAGYEEGEVPDVLLKAIRAKIGATFDDRGDGIQEKRTLSDKLLIQFKTAYAG